MSESEMIFKVLKRYWRTLLKWIFRLHDLPEITVDEFFDRINFDQPPVFKETVQTSEREIYFSLLTRNRKSSGPRSSVAINS